MTKIRVGFAKQNKKSPFNQDVLQKRLIELRTNELLDLYSQLQCSNQDHQNFENSITILLNPGEERVVVDRVCCENLNEKIMSTPLKKTQSIAIRLL